MADDAAHASILAIRLVDFAAQPVAAQAAMRERLEGVLARAIAGLAAADRVVLDTADGAALVGLGDAAAMLGAADAALAAAGAADLETALGLNAGPVKLAEEAGRQNVIGDGVGAALATAGFAAAGEMLASRAFRDAAVAQSAGIENRFILVGERTDASLRLHELYRCRPAAGMRPGRRRLVRSLGASAIVFLGSGFALRIARQDAARRSRPATVALDITPWAEISVGGVPRGRTPPLAKLELAPGRHTVAIRHGTAAPLVLDLDLKPGEQTTVRHAFAVPPAPQPPKSRPPQTFEQRVRGFLRKLEQ